MELTLQHGVTIFMSSHILAEVARLARRIGIIHNGRLLQELSMEDLERNRNRRLLIRAHDLEKACLALKSANRQAQITPDGYIEMKDAQSIAHPEEIASLLVQAGNPPTHLMVEEEELERYFLRLVGMETGVQNE